MEQLGLSMNAGAATAAATALAPEPAASVRRQPAEALPACRPGYDVARKGDDNHTEAEDRRGNVTEVIMPPGQVENFQLLLPMLTQLNRERRWLAWIDPPQELVSKWQTMHGIVASELLVLRSTRDYSAYELAERALGAGTCHAVVMWTSRLSSRAFGALEQASARGQSHGVILRTR
ncbi:cell division inhibitor SulA [Marinobacter lacisalsi]|uniref:Cell division inhibitor SulA n=1 Tax=Marinobacter lacisalsi TaxID=475979 RepID=A0ABV8QLG6_9GAMM